MYAQVQGNGAGGTWEELSLVSLLHRYCEQFSTTRHFRHAVLVAENNVTLANKTILEHQTFDGTRLILGTSHLIPSIDGRLDTSCQVFPEDTSVVTTSSWTQPARPEDYTYVLKPRGFSETVEPECRLVANPLFWWLTAVCNLAIACSLTSTLYLLDSAPLVTIGDTIDSFISNPSVLATRAACNYDHTAFTNMFRPRLVPRAYHKPRATRRWWQAVPLTRWALTALWFSGVIVLLVVCFGIARARDSPKSIGEM